MQKNFIPEILVSVILIIVLTLFLKPIGGSMPPKTLMTATTVFAVVYILFVSFIWRERARDEREQIHKMQAGRFAYIAGSAVMVVGIVVQSFHHTVDAWLVYALGAMILAKILGLIYGRIRQ